MWKQGKAKTKILQAISLKPKASLNCNWKNGRWFLLQILRIGIFYLYMVPFPLPNV